GAMRRGMARDSRLRIGGWLTGAGPRGGAFRRYGSDHGPDPSPVPDGQAADDALTVGPVSAADDTTWTPAGGARSEGAAAWPGGAGGGLGDGAAGSSEGAGWPPEDAAWPPGGSGWSSAEVCHPSEDAGRPSGNAGRSSEGAGPVDTVPEGPDRAGGAAGPYRGRRRRRRPFPAVAGVAAAVGLVLVGTGVIVHWTGTSGESSLGPPPWPDPSPTVPTVPTVPDGGRSVTPDGGVSSGPDDRDGDAGRGESRTRDGASDAGSAGDDAGSAGDEAGPAGDEAGSTGGAFEAEDGSLARGASVEALATASGGRVVRLSPNASVELSGITVGRSGAYHLTVHYAATVSRTAQVSVNGGPAVTVEFPALDRDAVGAVVLQVALAAGENTVTVVSLDLPGLMLDRVTVTAGPGRNAYRPGRIRVRPTWAVAREPARAGVVPRCG